MTNKTDVFEGDRSSLMEDVPIEISRCDAYVESFHGGDSNLTIDSTQDIEDDRKMAAQWRCLLSDPSSSTADKPETVAFFLSKL